MIWLGAMLGGPELDETPLVLALWDIKRHIAEARAESKVEEGGAIDLVLHLPGSQIELEYEGLRTGKFSGKEQMLMIQAAVPEDELDSEDPARFIFAVMREAISMAAPAFKKTNIPFSVEDHLALVDAVESEYRQA